MEFNQLLLVFFFKTFHHEVCSQNIAGCHEEMNFSLSQDIGVKFDVVLIQVLFEEFQVDIIACERMEASALSVTTDQMNRLPGCQKRQGIGHVDSPVKSPSLVDSEMPVSILIRRNRLDKDYVLNAS